MITKHTKDTVSEGFILGLRGIISQSEVIKQPFKSVIITIGLVMGVIVSIIETILKIDAYSYISEIQGTLIQLVPGLLGFTIAGYSFLTGFIRPTLMDRISEPLEGRRISLYQSISASLASNILFHAIILCIVYLVHIAVFIQEKNISLRLRIECLRDIINLAGVFVLNICLSCTLAIVIQIIVSAFNLSQLNHYDFNKAKLENLKKSENQLN